MSDEDLKAELERLRAENDYLKETLYRSRTASPILGRSKAMTEIFNQILKVAPTDFTVMIEAAPRRRSRSRRRRRPAES